MTGDHAESSDVELLTAIAVGEGDGLYARHKQLVREHERVRAGVLRWL